MMRRWCWLVLALACLAACGPAQGSVPFYELIADPARYHQQEVTVLGFYYQKDGEQLLVIGVRTDDGFQNPVPLGDPLWVDGMPQDVLNRLTMASGAIYGMVQVRGRFETGGAFGPGGKYASRLQITDPAGVIALESSQMQEDWIPSDLNVPGAVPLAELIAHPDTYSGQTVTVVGYYYETPQTTVLAEGIRSLDGVHNAVPIGQQVWVEGFSRKVRAELNVAGEGFYHGLVKVSGRFETRGGYGPNQSYPFRLNVRESEAIRR